MGLADEMPADAWIARAVNPEGDDGFEAAVRRDFDRLQKEEDNRRGDVRGGTSRYQYIFFRGGALELPQATRNMLAKLHGVLCHPSNERLARMLSLEGADEKIIQACKSMVCTICERLSPPRSDPKASAKAPQQFNEQTLHDSFFIWDPTGKKWAVMHILDGLCTYHVGSLVENPSSTADAFHEFWVILFGPPREAQVDAGPEFRGDFVKACRILTCC